MYVDPEKMMKTRPPGQAAFMRFAPVEGTLGVAFMLREETARIAALQDPEIELRAGVLEQDGVLLIPVLLRVGKEVQENIWETWWNFYASDLPPKFKDLSRQDELFIFFYGDSGNRERTIKCRNSWKDFFKQAYQLCVVHPSWSMSDYDNAREKIYARHPTVMDLWRSMQA